MIPSNYEDFSQALTQETPNNQWPRALQSLWYDAKGNWEASHNIAQDLHNDIGSWIHGYLHRKEGDTFNAGYWYRRAHKSFPNISLEEEHRKIVDFILSV